jgi:septal ring factor EnvC (AmiA/AmiB activator)
MKKRMSEVEEERGLLMTRMKELQATIDLLRGETGNYRKKLIEAEDRIKLLLAENETLLQNLLAFKNKQAEAVNVQNMAQEAARRQLTPQVRAAMEADMKVAEAAVQAADPAGQNRCVFYSALGSRDFQSAFRPCLIATACIWCWFEF